MDRTPIVTCKPPLQPRRGEHVGGIPGYDDNPAMKKGYFPDQDIVNKEYSDMIKKMKEIDLIHVLEIDFPNVRNLDYMQKIKNTQEFTKKTLGKNLRATNPNGYDLVDDTGELTQHDIVYIRDGFISNQENKILLSNFSRRERQIETPIIKEALEKVLAKYNIQRDIIIGPEGTYFEGGNFRYVPNEKLLFAGKQHRNNKAGIEFVKDQFGVKDNNILMIDGKSFHVDTYFSVVTGDDGQMIAGVICPNLIHKGKMQEIRDFFKKHNKILLEVDDSYGMGEKGNGTGSLATNTLQVNQFLMGCTYFDHDTEMKLEQLGVVRIITPLHEYAKSGGSRHCVTNQL